ncbi:nucleoside triphosphate pyrophosphohydrolase family protein [Lacticaseibacillus camelliae]|uniref:MazG nucleotide pyrophosphohydrolase n=1 Tax=Lacticaseibacillus camelliae DSM 22697 = JCM 13995 TaxID=1423730 RepID=A0A0R2ERG1_9LACO|nr:nucleoside triphosphate pyrophosphohydrolase family protein [Lacticaseibacillus camelliae]KRN18753.1 MazG nucleotide pyrophosphohydrolase [Lacticaseibacillus camelliae DSM 22697 = JCM 13995]
MNLNEYQQKANKTLAGNEHVLTNLTLGLASDSGLVVDRIKRYAFQGQDLEPDKLKDELGDVLWYLSQIALWADIPLDDVAKANLATLAKKYPEAKL